MKVGTRELRNTTADVIAAVLSGERVELTVRGESVADIVPHRASRTRWLTGETLRASLAGRQADVGLSAELDELAGQTIDDVIR
jgi:prevent-host-death family protein